VPRHENDTCIEDTDPPPNVKPESHRIHSDAHSETAHQQHQQNQVDQDTVTTEDAVYNATTTPENTELRHQSKVHKHEHIEKQTDGMGKCSDKGDKTIEGMDTELPWKDKEGAQDDMRTSTKRSNRMKLEKTGEPQNERSRSSTRRTVHKDRKTLFLIPTQNPPTPPTLPMSIIKIARLNINGITARTRVGMLADFV